MPIDPSIIGQLRQPQIINPAQLISLKNLQRAGQIQELTLAEQQRQARERGQVQQTFQQPGAIDPTTGMPTSEAIGRVMQASPEMGVKLAQQRLTTLAALSADRMRKEQMLEKQMGVKKDIGRATVNAYDLALKQSGGNEQEAVRAATEARNKAIEELRTSGQASLLGMTDQELQQATMQPPNIMGLRAHFFTPAEMAKEETPLSALGKLDADYKAKRISKEDYDAQKKKLLSPTTTMMYQTSGLLSPDAVGMVADQVLAGDTSALQGYSRNPLVRTQIMNEVVKRAQKRGISGAKLAALRAEFGGIQAGERALGTRTANIEMAVTEAQNVIPLAEDASKAVDRTKYPTLNAVILAVKKGTGDPAAARFVAANNALMNIYSRAIAPTGTPTVFDKAHAEDVLSTAYAQGQYSAVVDMMRSEMEAARKSPGQVRSAMRTAITGNEGGEPEGGQLKAQVEKSGWNYEPEKYDYRVSPDGKVQRRKKGG